jgi:hypothetical protein
MADSVLLFVEGDAFFKASLVLLMLVERFFN